MEVRQRSKKYDVLVWGATGYTGTLVCEYLNELTSERLPHLQWAMGGRNQKRLEAIRERLAKTNEKTKNVDIQIADVNHQDLIENVIGQTRVVINTAGPFALVGTPIVEACVKLGVDYVDITGESHWVKRLIENYQYHEVAARKGIFIVPFCGFDSVPSDISSFAVSDYIKNKLGKRTADVRMAWFLNGGGFSGGTFHSMLNFFSSPPKELKDATATYALNPRDYVPNTDPSDPLFPSYNSTIGTWTVPFFMGSVNTRVVRRSNALIKSHYGDRFNYMEYHGMKGLVMTGVVWVFLVSLITLLYFKFTRSILKKIGPKQGEGPSPEALKKGGSKVVAVGRTDEQSPRKVQCTLQFPQNMEAGYFGTSRMVTEAALCLALQREQVVANTQSNGITGGVLTPASCFGNVLVTRLRDVGISIEVKEI